MRTFKFRVWDEYNKRFLVSLHDNGLLFGFGNASNKNIEKYGGWGVTDCISTPNCGLIVQQFTGLLDKNGKEIYEGDLLKYSYSDGSGTYTEEVYFSNHFGSFAVKTDKTFETFQNLIENGDGLEVVGNIFENENTKI